MRGPSFLMVPSNPVWLGFLRLFWSLVEGQCLSLPHVPALSGANSGANNQMPLNHLTLNQRVQGSSPCAPTNLFNGLNAKPKTENSLQ